MTFEQLPPARHQKRSHLRRLEYLALFTILKDFNVKGTENMRNKRAGSKSSSPTLIRVKYDQERGGKIFHGKDYTK
jgi:hypothetical protein